MEGQYVAFYLIFISLIAVAGYFGADLSSGADISSLPVLDDSPGLFGTIGYGFEFVGYLLGFQGLTIFGIPSFIALLIAFVLDGLMVYVLIRLVRGGG